MIKKLWHKLFDKKIQEDKLSTIEERVRKYLYGEHNV